MSKMSKRATSALATSLMASTMLAGSAVVAHAAAAAPTAESNTVAEVIVTAQKQEESLQKVSLSIQALDSKTLAQRNVSEFQDYVKYLPSVSFQTTAPSVTSIYMRGVASGENSNHSGPLPSVGLYLDEQSVTTIGGALDVHVYDVARIESLAGPQGTLYGASSESGTVRIITNKPTSAAFSAGYDVQANVNKKGAPGYEAEGFVNVPVNEKVAVRLVGWAEHDGGYIDNIAGTRVFPSAEAANGTAAATLTNANLVKKNFNPVDTVGGRAALKVDLNDTWTIMPSVIAQDQRQEGVFGYQPGLGDLNVQHFLPDRSHDRWYQASMTVTGKISKFDVTYTGGYFQRQVNSQSDYTDYSYWYDKVAAYGNSWVDNNGNVINHPSQFIIGTDQFDKTSQELRIASPKTDRFRFVAGVFQQRQSHWIVQDYKIAGLADNISVTGHPGTVWLTDQMRVDRDSAVFGQVAYDLTDKLTVTAGLRFYDYKNSLEGFYGFSTGLSSHTGEAKCFTPFGQRGAPCMNLDKTVSDSGNTYKLDITYKLDDNKLIYATVANGYRPGGVNRNGSLPPYAADELTSYEFGWKTSLLEKRIRFNGAVYYEDWNNFQYSFLGQNSLTIIANAGQAKIFGLESDAAFVVTPHFTLSGAMALTSAELTKDYCNDLTQACPTASNPVLAANGQQLPVTPAFKANATARYTFDLMDWSSHVQGSVIYSDSAWSDLRNAERGILGEMPSYTLVDLSAGGEKDNLSVEVFVKNLFDERANLTRYVECTTAVCGQGGPYVVPQQPRIVGIRVGQKF